MCGAEMSRLSHVEGLTGGIVVRHHGEVLRMTMLAVKEAAVMLWMLVLQKRRQAAATAVAMLLMGLRPSVMLR